MPPALRRTAQTEDSWVASARSLLDLMCRVAEVEDLGSISVLDIGCGTNLVKVFREERRPIGRYVGVDASAEIIDFLQDNVADRRFEFHHIDVHNERYNPAGTPLRDYEPLPLVDQQFDLITLFSVFTHLAPHDYTTMLRVLRPHAHAKTRLLFSLFVDERRGPRPENDEVELLPPADRLAQPIGEEMRRRIEAGDRELEDRLRRTLHDAHIDAVYVSEPPDRIPDFVDLFPDKPLLMAIYSSEYAYSLFADSGWEPLALHRPEEPYIQHYFVCKPVNE